MTTVVVCGLKREAAAIRRAGSGIAVITAGGDVHRLERELGAHLRAQSGLVLSSGLAGALDPALQPGAVVVDGDAAIVSRLVAMLPEALPGLIVGRDTITATAQAKQDLREETGAAAVDMETHVARAVAQSHGVPFAAIRAISDSADENLPSAALVGMRPDGGVALGAVLGSLAREPSQLPRLMRTARHAGRAMRALDRVYDALGRSGIFGLDLGDFALDQA